MLRLGSSGKNLGAAEPWTWGWWNNIFLALYTASWYMQSANELTHFNVPYKCTSNHWIWSRCHGGQGDDTNNWCCDADHWIYAATYGPVLDLACDEVIPLAMPLFLHPGSLWVTRGIAREIMSQFTSHICSERAILTSITIPPTYEVAVMICPPNFEPEDTLWKRLNCNMKIELKVSPLVVLITYPNIVDTYCPVYTSLQVLTLASSNIFRMMKIHIAENELSGCKTSTS